MQGKSTEQKIIESIAKVLRKVRILKIQFQNRLTKEQKKLNVLKMELGEMSILMGS